MAERTQCSMVEIKPVIRKVHVTTPIEDICKILREEGVISKAFPATKILEQLPAGAHI